MLVMAMLRLKYIEEELGYYKMIPDNLKTGYFILYLTKNTFYHKIIVGAQKKAGFTGKAAKIVHTEPIINKRWGVDSKIPRITVSEIIVRHKDQYAIVVKPKIYKYDDYSQAVAIQCLTRVNLPYGLIGLFWFKLRKYIKRNFFAFFGDFCSELCGYGIWMVFVEGKKKGFSQFLPKRFDELYPADFLDPRYFEVVWEGEVNSLKK